MDALGKRWADASDDWARTGLIRHWLARTIPFTLLESHTLDNSVMLTWPLGRLFAELTDRTKGTICGGAANLLARLHLLFGYESVCINIGEPSIGLTHMATLTRIRHNGKSLDVVQDGYFNTALTDDGGEPIDYGAALITLRQHMQENVRLVQIDPRRTEIIEDKHAASGIQLRETDWVWADPNWKEWLNQKVSSPEMVGAYGFPFEICFIGPATGLYPDACALIAQMRGT